jgi:hypothetical protein
MPVRPDVIIPRRATYEDYRHFPDDGKRYEILDGEIYMTPHPVLPGWGPDRGKPWTSS